MKTFYLQFTLKSDTTFGRGDGVIGIVDNEIQHDQLGCPILSGREIKGILVNGSADILASLKGKTRERWELAANHLFGQPASTKAGEGQLKIGDARLPEDLRKSLKLQLRQKLQKINEDVNKEGYSGLVQEIENSFRIQVLESLCAIRQQTALDDETGIAKEHSLRAIRVVIRETPFEAVLVYDPGGTPSDDDTAFLIACVKTFRRVGAGRNRGRGRIEAILLDENHSPMPSQIYNLFTEGVKN